MQTSMDHEAQCQKRFAREDAARFKAWRQFCKGRGPGKGERVCSPQIQEKAPENIGSHYKAEPSQDAARRITLRNSQWSHESATCEAVSTCATLPQGCDICISCMRLTYERRASDGGGFQSEILFGEPHAATYIGASFEFVRGCQSHPQGSDILSVHSSYVRRRGDQRWRIPKPRLWVLSVRAVRHMFHVCAEALCVSMYRGRRQRTGGGGSSPASTQRRALA